jgi:hypothetical protein
MVATSRQRSCTSVAAVVARRVALVAMLGLALGLPARATAAGTRRPRQPVCHPQDGFIPIAHGDGGGVWIPRELWCGGNAPVIIMLHGNNSDHVQHVSLGGGRELGKLARRMISSGKSRPVVLAEPVHFQRCGTGLYGKDYDFPSYRIKLEAVLAVHGIRVKSYSVVGHSGAGCCGGVHRAADAFGPLKVFGVVDTCYGDPDYAGDINQRFADSRTVVFSASRGNTVYANFLRFERLLLGKKRTEVKCDAKRYRACVRSKAHPHFYSFRTARRDRRYHSEIPVDAYRTILARFFGRPKPAAAVASRDPAASTDRKEPAAAGDRTQGAGQ